MTSILTVSHYTTAQFGQAVNVRPESIRRGLCIRGHYLGIRPIKLENGRLLWPVAMVNKVLSGDATTGVKGDTAGEDDKETAPVDEDGSLITSENESGAASHYRRNRSTLLISPPNKLPISGNE